jgi:hypothetical protein
MSASFKPNCTKLLSFFVVYKKTFSIINIRAPAQPHLRSTKMLEEVFTHEKKYILVTHEKSIYLLLQQPMTHAGTAVVVGVIASLFPSKLLKSKYCL